MTCSFLSLFDIMLFTFSIISCHEFLLIMIYHEISVKSLYDIIKFWTSLSICEFARSKEGKKTGTTCCPKQNIIVAFEI